MAYALLVPGSASTGNFLARAFGPVLAGLDLVEVTDPSGDAQRIAARLGQVFNDLVADGCCVDVVIGLSVGAHAAAFWAAGQSSDLRPLLVVAMPAWTGNPGVVAQGTAAAVARLAELGVTAELERLQAQFPGDWVVTELVRAWTAMTPQALQTSLAGTARSIAPNPQQLGSIDLPAVVLALRDDPMHPAAVAHTWAQAIPGALLVEVGRDEPGVDVAVFGRRVRSRLSPRLGRSAAAPAVADPAPPPAPQRLAEQPAPPAAE